MLCELTETLFWEPGLHIQPPLPFESQVCLSQTILQSPLSEMGCPLPPAFLTREESTANSPRVKTLMSLETAESEMISAVKLHRVVLPGKQDAPFGVVSLKAKILVLFN